MSTNFSRRLLLKHRLDGLALRVQSRCAKCKELPGYVVRFSDIAADDSWAMTGSNRCAKCGYRPAIITYLDAPEIEDASGTHFLAPDLTSRTPEAIPVTRQSRIRHVFS